MRQGVRIHQTKEKKRKLINISKSKMYDYIQRIIDMATCTKSVDRRWLHNTELIKIDYKR